MGIKILIKRLLHSTRESKRIRKNGNFNLFEKYTTALQWLWLFSFRQHFKFALNLILFFIFTVDLGEERPRTILSGLVKHYSLEQMQVSNIENIYIYIYYHSSIYYVRSFYL